MENILVRSSGAEHVSTKLRDYHPDRLDGFIAPTRWSSSALSWDSWEPTTFPTIVKVSPLRQDTDESLDFPRYWPSIFSEGGKQLEFQWLFLVTECDLVDPGLAFFLSRELRTEVLAVHASDATDAYGFCVYGDGELHEQYFREMEERPVYRIDKELEMRGIPYCLERYCDCSGPGWRTVMLSS